MKASSALAALLLAACGSNAPTPPANRSEPRDEAATPTARPPGGEKVAGPLAIRGEWRVAGIAGQPVDQREGITVSILPQEIHAVAGCVRWNWSYTLAAGMLEMRRRATAVPPCLRGLTPAEGMFEQAMTAAHFAVRRPDNSLVLSGPSGDVVLFTQ